MNKKVCVKSEENIYELHEQLAVKDHPCYGLKKETVAKLHESHERAKKIAQEIAEEEDPDVEINALSNSFKSRISAFFRRIKTPTIEIGNKRVNGVPSKEKLLYLLDEKEIL